MTNEKNQKVMTTLKNIAAPLGLTAAILMLLSALLHGMAYGNTEKTGEVISLNIDVAKIMMDMGRYAAIPAILLGLGAAGLLIAIAVLQFIDCKKALKQNLTTGLVNAIVGAVLISFVIISLTLVFDVEKWSYYYFENEYQKIFIGSEDAAKVFVYMGMVFALSMYAALYSLVSNKAKSTDIKVTMRTIGLFTMVTSLVAILPVLISTGIGLQKPEASWYIEYKNDKILSWYSAGLLIKFSLAVIGTISLALLTMIPLAIFGTKDYKKYVIISSITGGIALILFIAAASMAKVMWLYEMMAYEKYSQCKWWTDCSSTSAMALLAWISGLVGGCILFKKTKKILAQA